MNRRKFLGVVPAALLLAQQASAANAQERNMAQARKKGVMLMNRIGSSSSQLYIANADGTDKRMLTDSLWEDAMPLYIPAKVY